LYTNFVHPEVNVELGFCRVRAGALCLFAAHPPKTRAEATLPKFRSYAIRPLPGLVYFTRVALISITAGNNAALGGREKSDHNENRSALP
jgi:hypothetical protein